MSGRSIDHVVIAVNSLDQAAAAYEHLGFTLTPRAFHEDRMGTSNRLVQLAGHNFIELLEVDRPDTLAPHDFTRTPPLFSFGAHNKAAAARRNGISMLVFASDDARADIAAFHAAGVPTYAPFDFQRQAKLPDGSEVTVAFSLGFATSPDMPDAAFFACQNRAPQYFWKPDYQVHDNGAQSIRTVYLASPAPARDAAFVSRLFGGTVEPMLGGMRVACGEVQDVRVLSPQAIAAKDPSFPARDLHSPLLAGIAVTGAGVKATTPATEAFGLFIEWAGV